MAEIGEEFGEEFGEFFPVELPRVEVADAGGVNHVAAEIEGKDLDAGRGVSAFSGALRDLLYSEAKAGLEAAEECGFAGAGGAGEDGEFVAERCAELFEAGAFESAGVEELVAGVPVDDADLLGLREGDEVGFVYADAGGEVGVACGDEEAVSEVPFEIGLCDGEDGEELVGVCDDDLADGLGSGGAASEDAFSREALFYGPAVALGGGEADEVADGNGAEVSDGADGAGAAKAGVALGVDELFAELAADGAEVGFAAGGNVIVAALFADHAAGKGLLVRLIGDRRLLEYAAAALRGIIYHSPLERTS